jgi:hypothetical protein
MKASINPVLSIGRVLTEACALSKSALLNPTTLIPPITTWLVRTRIATHVGSDLSSPLA